MGNKLTGWRLQRFAVAAVWAWLWCVPLLTADEVVRADGRRLTGRLTLDAKGRPRFTPAGRTTPLSPTDIAAVRFDDGPPAPFRVGAGHRVRLQDGQLLTGQLLSLNKESLRLRTAWAEQVELPRAAVAAVTHLPGWRTLVQDDFAEGLKAWVVTGAPRVEGGGKAPRGVIFDRAGQSLTYQPAMPVEAGRVGLVFEEVGAAAGARWLMEVQYQGKGKPVTLRVVLAGASRTVEVAVPGLQGQSRRVVLAPGPHLVLVQFKAASLRVACDDDVLWYNLDRGPGGPLRQVVLRCQEVARPADVRGAVAVSEFTLARAVDEPPRPPGDAGQDEIWLASDDQLFGRLVRADRHGVEIEGRYGLRSFAWVELRGCFLKREPAPPRLVGAAAARLELHSGLIPEPDLLDGLLIGLDDKKLTLRHALLGEQNIEKSRVKELRFLLQEE